MKGNDNSKELFPEHEFLGSCLRIGLQVSDLEKLTYIDVMKLFVTFIKQPNGTRKPTQNDIDKLLG